MRLIALSAAGLLLASCGPHAPTQMVAVGTGYAAHELCGAAFIAGLDPERYWAEAAPPAFGAVPLRYTVDRERREVRASLAGAVERRAVDRGPAGCLVVNGPEPPPPTPLPPAAPPLLGAIAPGPEPVAPVNAALAAALDRAMAAEGSRAVLVLRDGLVLGERYAPGYGPETRLHGWSLTKSITNALLGRLVMQRRLDMRAPAGILEWRNDARAAITPEHLLRMTSGLGFGQSLEAGIADLWNPASQMQFAGHDMAAMAAAAPLVAAPGTRFVYQNGNTQLLSRLVRDLAGGDEAAVLRYAQAELFGPLGMAGAVLETDATGTPVGGSHAWAGARDWARFGVLFAQDGVVGGQRLLPEGWLAWSAAPTPGAEFIGYGAGFWTQRGEGGAAYRREQGLPEEALMARGAFGQYVIAVPSRRLVVVRLGFSYDPRARVESVARLVAEAMAALE